MSETSEFQKWLSARGIADGYCGDGQFEHHQLAYEAFLHGLTVGRYQPAAQAVPDEWRDALQGLVDDIEGLIGESDGVAGLHLNGDTARWGELPPGGRFERLTYLAVARELLGTQHGLEEIQQQYGVRYYRDQHITVNGRPGVIKEANRQYLRVQFEGVDGLRNCHPTWEVQAVTTPPAPPFATGWLHITLGEDGEPDDYEFHDARYYPPGITPCPDCIPAKIVLYGDQATPPAARKVYGCPRCGTGMEVDESAKPAGEVEG